jgi:hypothetical protein
MLFGLINKDITVDINTKKFTTQKKHRIGTEYRILGITAEGTYVLAWEKDIFRHVQGQTWIMNVKHNSSNKADLLAIFENEVYLHELSKLKANRRLRNGEYSLRHCCA